MIDNKLLQIMLIASCVLLLVAIAMTWADIARYGGAAPAVAAAPARTGPAEPAEPTG